VKLILLRHGESQWNLENRFTGWTDVPLTSKGKKEALLAGKDLIKNNLDISSIYTSILSRAFNTAKIVSEIINFPEKNIECEWRLNERHYGALQGLNKSETAAKYGEEQVHIWRRSFDIQPPLLSDNDSRHIELKNKFRLPDSNFPLGESLKNVIDRLNPFLDIYFKLIKEKKGNHLIVAHSNSLRAIIKILDQLSNDDIVSVNIPTGIPLIYTLSSDLNVIEKKYLISDKKLKEKQNMILNQGKAK
tara:strand:+ start:2084 stop:2824 length:741 start_codon:yes stop_codon:yes gene_type:complete